MLPAGPLVSQVISKSPATSEVETANTTSRGQMFEHADSRQSNVQLALVQDHKNHAGLVDEYSAKLEARGWKSFWSPAFRCQQGGFSCGVLIIVPWHLSCWAPKRRVEIAPGRVVH